jgi:transcriptional regulator with XRE-family HTH domain
MCPAKGTPRARREPVTRSRANNANWVLMDWLNGEREARKLSLRAVARTMGYLNASRVGEYLYHKIVPGPEIVRRLAIAIGVSPIEALWMGGHDSAVFEYFLKLHRLGWAWMREDEVHFDPNRGASFFPEQWSPDVFAHRYHEATVYNLVGPFRTVALPIPSACAFLLAIGLFVRRGDVLRSGTRELVRELSLIASEMLPMAERADAPKQIDYIVPFKEAERVVSRRFGDRWTRLAIVSEYVHSWCDVICPGYAQYARVALYSQGGLIAEPKHNRYVVEDLWKWQVADPVIADEFRSHGSAQT